MSRAETHHLLISQACAEYRSASAAGDHHGLANLVRLIHIGNAFAFVGGLLGRWILLRRAAAAADPETAYQLAEAASPFEWMVIRGGPAILIAGLLG